MERLQKVIANSGYTSRRKAEELITSGHVTVDGSIVTELGFKASPKNKIEIDGVRLFNEQKVYYILNKPRGVVTTASDDKNRTTVVDLIDTDKRIYPVGRLDYDTTGVLLLTNDGDFMQMITHPKNEIEKEYIVKVDGIVKGEHIVKMKSGVVIDGVKSAPAYVKLKAVNKVTNSSMLKIIIHEGKNHQVKKMVESTGFRVDKLKRERIGFLTTKGLKSGEYRMLTPKEISQLYVLVNETKKKRK
ncbi:MAG: pseudouridine synthase [Bacilli bacterium]